jgi:aspartyl-tRNA(Asn)/glutamyl-tRNA(Gln) amidotransferase subunit C
MIYTSAYSIRHQALQGYKDFLRLESGLRRLARLWFNGAWDMEMSTMSKSESSESEGIDVEYVAALARLQLTAEECELFRTQLADIVGYVKKIGELDLSSIEPMAHGSAVENVFRQDKAAISQPVEDTTANAPVSRDDQFIVPKIIE